MNCLERAKNILLLFHAFPRIVKLASPNLNYFIIFGAGLLYVCVFLYSYSTSETESATIICNVSNIILIYC